jgi:hypothetical protein
MSENIEWALSRIFRIRYNFKYKRIVRKVERDHAEGTMEKRTRINRDFIVGR